MAIDKITDHKAQAIARLLTQYRNKPNIEAILPPPDPNAGPSPEQIEQMSKIQERKDKAELEAAKIEIQNKKIAKDLAMMEAEIEKLKTESIKNIAEAEAKEAGTQIEQYKAVVDRLAQEGKQRADEAKQAVQDAAAAPNPLDELT